MGAKLVICILDEILVLWQNLVKSDRMTDVVYETRRQTAACAIFFTICNLHHSFYQIKKGMDRSSKPLHTDCCVL